MESKRHSLNLVLKKRGSQDAFSAQTPIPPDFSEKVSVNGTLSSYRHTAASLAEDCFAIDSLWLVGHAPNLWSRLCWLDEEASAYEQRGETGPEYRNVLSRIVTTVREARKLYEQATDKEAIAS